MTLTTTPTIRSITNDKILVYLERESIQKDRYFYLEYDVSNECGNGKFYKKITIPKNCFDLILGPNPATNNLSIALESGIKKIEIIDNYGQMKFQSDLSGIGIVMNETIDISNLLNGTYKNLIADSEGETYQKEFVVLR